jgi:hypothetical protein
VVGVKVASPVVLAMAHDVIASQVGLIEKDYDSVVAVVDEAPTEAEGNVLPLRLIDINDTVTDFIVLEDSVQVG